MLTERVIKERLIIGIVGKVSSGKTTVSEYIKRKRDSVLVLDADKIAKEIYYKDVNILKDLREFFGDDIFDSEREINFDVLARKVFSNQNELKKLNRLMFPLIRKEIKNILNGNRDKKYIIIDAAVLFNCKLDLLCDFIIWVKTKRERMKELLKKKNKCFTDEDIKLRMDGQLIVINKNGINFIIDNNGTKSDLYKKTEYILRKIEQNQYLKNL